MTFYLDIVSAESEIFKGPVHRVFATGVEGELEIASRHAPLLTRLLPGPIRLESQEGKEGP